ncbi:hypothetical protein [Leifsonia sp. Leaf264]|uniref:hypothetical protein n=1 Tax=Leifsonia sp. Leaf264 TaxID=1736314 RepID=UPI0006FAC6D7|nr:hypothetical protein [Leifsonia sp. Leaf264]KQO98114.1 hypothetical protein ASF30_08440 [Leifsonia sp. Leaf264]
MSAHVGVMKKLILLSALVVAAGLAGACLGHALAPILIPAGAHMLLTVGFEGMLAFVGMFVASVPLIDHLEKDGLVQHPAGAHKFDY